MHLFQSTGSFAVDIARWMVSWWVDGFYCPKDSRIRRDWWWERGGTSPYFRWAVCHTYGCACCRVLVSLYAPVVLVIVGEQLLALILLVPLPNKITTTGGFGKGLITACWPQNVDSQVCRSKRYRTKWTNIHLHPLKRRQCVESVWHWQRTCDGWFGAQKWECHQP